MARRRLVFRPAERHRGERLDRFLTAALAGAEESEGRTPEGRTLDGRTPEGRTPISRRRVRRLIAAGAVYLDGRRCHIASRPLRPGARLEVVLDPQETRARPRQEPELDVEPRVLFEDRHLIAVDKPAGVAAQATDDDDVHHLFAAVRRFLAAREGVGRPYLALHHRLDRGTSGVMLLSKSRAANAGLAAAFREQRVKKTYLALGAVNEPPPDDEWTVRDRLVLRRQDRGIRAVSVERGGRPAETRFRVRERFAGAVLVAAAPRTGRTHQVRIHLAGSGVPVLGDHLYGPAQPSIVAPRLMLHAAMLELEHPLGGETVRIESPLPEDFRRLLESLRARVGAQPCAPT